MASGHHLLEPRGCFRDPSGYITERYVANTHSLTERVAFMSVQYFSYELSFSLTVRHRPTQLIEKLYLCCLDPQWSAMSSLTNGNRVETDSHAERE